MGPLVSTNEFLFLQPAKPFFVSPSDLSDRLGTPSSPLVINAIRLAARATYQSTIPSAIWRDIGRIDTWAALLPEGREIVVFCVHGHNVSQLAASSLRALGQRASVLEGGIESWRAEGLPLIRNDILPELKSEAIGTRWVSGRTPTAETMAAAWIVRRFLDASAKFQFVEDAFVEAIVNELPGQVLNLTNVCRASSGTDEPDHLFATSPPGWTEFSEIVEAVVSGRHRALNEAPGVADVLSGALSLARRDGDLAMAMSFPVFDALYQNCRAREVSGESNGEGGSL
ncbi:MAG: chromate resistance protein ChrB domain-containing protein [Pseudomonadota bacterium]